MHLDKYCPGCGGGAGNQPCAIARCSKERDGIEYCYLCEEYPCEKYENIDKYDSFITHRNQLKDFQRVKKIGIDAYLKELDEKIEILKYLLENFNDGRRKTFFCLAINILDLHDVRIVMEQISAEIETKDLTIKEKAAIAVSAFQTTAEKRGVLLKLNKKSNK